MIRTRNDTAAPGRKEFPVRPQNHCHEFIEQLEERRLLSASLKGSVLNVVGTKKSDEIVLSRQAGKNGRLVVEIGNKRQLFAVGKKLKSITVRGMNGHDQITILETKKTSLKLPLAIDGGSGNDLIFASNGHDEIYGGSGNDTINAGKGNDYIEGRVGNDSLSGDSGNDQIYGDAGNDELLGGAGNDTLGGDGEDRLKFWDNPAPAPVIGNDILNGGSGNDWLLGGGETETLNQPWMKNGVDTMTGGSGNDIIDARGDDDVITDAQTTDFIPFRDNVNDLSTGRTQYIIHTHVLLKVFVDGKFLEMPIGLGEFGVPIIHKDDPSDRDFIHLHHLNEMHTWKLGEIFQVLGVSFSKTHIGRHRLVGGNKMTMNVRFQFEGNNAWRQSSAFDQWTIRSTDVRGTDIRDEILIQFTTAKKKK